MNPTNFSCPSDISMLNTTDYRQSKALYTNVVNSNNFRLFLQRNAAMIRANNLQQFRNSMGCACEGSPGQNQDNLYPTIPQYFSFYKIPRF